MVNVMTYRSGINLEHLCFLATTGRFEHLKECLYRPDFITWASLSSGDFSRQWDRLKSLLSPTPPIQRFLELHLITETLLFRSVIPDWVDAHIRGNIDPGLHFDEIPWDVIRAGHWHSIPVLLVLSQSHLRYFILGAISSDFGAQTLWPAWAEPLMDSTTKQALKVAAVASSHPASQPAGCRPYCYPLTVPGETVQFQGSSLGLPVALGFTDVMSPEDRDSPSLVATGTIDEKGNIFSVEQMEQKAALAWDKGFRVFLHPAGASPFFAPLGLETLPVSSLEEAGMFSALYQPGKAGKLAFFSQALVDPCIFVNNCDMLDMEWLRWAHRNGKLQAITDSILKSGDLLMLLSSKLKDFLAAGRLAEAEGLAALIPGDRIAAAMETAPLAAFLWCGSNLALANHRGRLKEAMEWVERASTVSGSAMETHRSAFFEFFIHRFIVAHNAYRFDPVLEDLLQQMLSHLESEHALNRTGPFGCSTNDSLGRLYGTIAQNYAFCGSGYLREVEKYVRLAQDVFGGGRVAERREDWRRQFNYLVYACLDAGRFEEAERALLNYLGITDWAGLKALLPLLSSWQHAALARYLADVSFERSRGATSDQEDLTKDYFDWSFSRRKALVKEQHPWQLWTNNAARMGKSLGEMGKALELFLASLDLCLSESSGPTIRIMALLPLSGLKGMGLASVEVKAPERILQTLRETVVPTLENPHFSVLMEKDAPRVLEEVCEKVKLYFPFSYR